jgi:hypothetical protein
MPEQHLHNKVGNAIGEARRRMLDRLKGGGDLDDVAALFIGEMRLAFETIARSESEPENVKEESALQ